MLLRTFLSNESSETLDSLTTFGFPMSVRVSNLLLIIGWFGCFWGRPIRFNEEFCFAFLRFFHWWDVKPPRGISFIFIGFCFHLHLMGLKLTPSCPFFFFFCLFAYRMTRGYEEVSNSQVRHWRGTPRETSTVSSLVAAMSTEELRLYN